jgi:hypothetical protein
VLFARLPFERVPFARLPFELVAFELFELGRFALVPFARLPFELVAFELFELGRFALLLEPEDLDDLVLCAIPPTPFRLAALCALFGGAPCDRPR